MNRKLFVLALIVFALVVPVSVLSAQGGPSISGPAGGGVPVGAEALGAVLYDQSGSPSGNSYTAQDFEASFDQYDAEIADDFDVPAGMMWEIDGVFISGAYFGGTGPLSSIDIVFRMDNAGVPGAVACAQNGVVPTGDVLGAVTVEFPTTCDLEAGTYWMAVQGNMDFGVGGQWGFEGSFLTNGYEAVWRNPGGGFGLGCADWGGVLSDCGLTSYGETDFSFTIYGTEGVAEEEEEEAEELPDGDGDGVADMYDNCLYIANSWQEDTDGDGIGDACDYPLSVLLGCPNDVLTYMGYSGADGDVACRATMAEDDWDVPAAPSGHSYAMDPAYMAYFTVFGIDAESGNGMTSLSEPMTVCFDGGMGATAIGVYYDDYSTGWEGTWMMLDTFEMNGNLCAASTQLGYFAAFTG